MKRVWIGIGVVVVLALIVVLSIKGGGGKKGTRVYVEEVGRRAIVHTVKARGTVTPRVKVDISAHVIARIDRLYVKEGQEITAGQPFLELERAQFVAARDSYAAQIAMARTEVLRADVGLADARVRQDRNRRLREQGILSTERQEATDLEVRSAELELQRAKESVQQAEAGYRSAVEDLSKTTIFAPLSGRVIALNAEAGEVVVSGTMNNPASVIGTIADLSEILVEVDVDETEIVAVALGQKGRIDVDAVPDHPYHGEVVEIGSSGYTKPMQPDVNFFRVKILLSDPDQRLRPGMSARAEVEVDTKAEALVVPIQAVVERLPLDSEEPEAAGATSGGAKDEEIKVVFVVEGPKDKEVARQRPVVTGLSDTTHVELTSGVEPGQRVVTGPYRGLKDLADGDRLKIATEKDDAKKKGSGEAADEESDDEESGGGEGGGGA